MLHARKICFNRLSSYFAGFEGCRISEEEQQESKLEIIASKITGATAVR